MFWNDFSIAAQHFFKGVAEGETGACAPTFSFCCCCFLGFFFFFFFFFGGGGGGILSHFENKFKLVSSGVILDTTLVLRDKSI